MEDKGEKGGGEKSNHINITIQTRKAEGRSEVLM
jgi:hypothetical protein